MDQTILIILGLVVIVILIVLFRKNSRNKIVGICAVALEQSVKKNENKQKILELLNAKNGLSNSEIREILGFSERSVVRYMEELEKAGKVEQVGEIGRNVIYRPKT